MADHPIIYSAPMVRALLDDRKTQTRRIITKRGALDALAVFGPQFLLKPGNVDLCPFGQPGDRLWVRENVRAEELSDGLDVVRYAADGIWGRISDAPTAGDDWLKLFYYRGRGKDGIGNPVPSIHMPRWASRLTLVVNDIRAQRLHDISEEDAVAEGALVDHSLRDGTADGSQPPMVKIGPARHITLRGWYHRLWDDLHGPAAWDANPWVWALTFIVHRGNIDALPAQAVAA